MGPRLPTRYQSGHLCILILLQPCCPVFLAFSVICYSHTFLRACHNLPPTHFASYQRGLQPTFLSKFSLSDSPPFLLFVHTPRLFSYVFLLALYLSVSHHSAVFFVVDLFLMFPAPQTALQRLPFPLLSGGPLFFLACYHAAPRRRPLLKRS